MPIIEGENGVILVNLCQVSFVQNGERILTNHR
jgi:hypothetical protein